MKKFVKNIIYFLLINLAVFIVVIWGISIIFSLKNWQRDPDVYVIPSSNTYNFLIMGTSHANIFTRFSNQGRVEKILGKKFFNLSQPGSGPVIEKLYLKVFLDKKNRSQRIVYFIDPYALYSDRWNENYFLLLYGKFDLLFLRNAISSQIGATTLMNYIRTYLSLKWFIKNPRPDKTDSRVYSYTKSQIIERLNFLYPEGLTQNSFIKYTQSLNEVIQIAKKNNMKITFIVPTTLIKNLPGTNQTLKLLEKYKKDYNIMYYDYSNLIQDNNLYGDEDHLNSDGISFFTKYYLKQILQIN